jgi:hypothetical protein
MAKKANTRHHPSTRNNKTPVLTKQEVVIVKSSPPPEAKPKSAVLLCSSSLPSATEVLRVSDAIVTLKRQIADMSQEIAVLNRRIAETERFLTRSGSLMSQASLQLTIQARALLRLLDGHTTVKFGDWDIIIAWIGNFPQPERCYLLLFTDSTEFQCSYVMTCEICAGDIIHTPRLAIAISAEDKVKVLWIHWYFPIVLFLCQLIFFRNSKCVSNDFLEFMNEQFPMVCMSNLSFYPYFPIY